MITDRSNFSKTMPVVNKKSFLSEPTREIRIINGKDSSTDDYPYIVSLLFCQTGSSTCNQCGGTIIESQFILTAAHCYDENEHKELYIKVMYDSKLDEQYYLLGYDLSDPSEIWFQHPEYQEKRLLNDIAVLHIPKLTMIVQNTQTDSVIKIAEEPPKIGQRLLVAGWGVTVYEDNIKTGETTKSINTNTLQIAEIPRIPDYPCRNLMGITYGKQFCLGYPQGGTDACLGDSGGPAFDNNQKILYGIISYGIGCARAYKPGVYTNVAFYRDWIDSVVNSRIGKISQQNNNENENSESQKKEVFHEINKQNNDDMTSSFVTENSVFETKPEIPNISGGELADLAWDTGNVTADETDNQLEVSTMLIILFIVIPLVIVISFLRKL